MSECLATTHLASRTVRCAVQRFGVATATDHVTWGSHTAWDHAENALPSRCGSLAMDNCLLTIHRFAPGEVVMILDSTQHVEAQGTDDQAVNYFVVGAGVTEDSAELFALLFQRERWRIEHT